MIIELDEKAQETLDQAELVIITERVDDVVLLLGQMIRMGMVEALDNHLPWHWKQRGLSWGRTVVIWLAHILTEGNHRSGVYGKAAAPPSPRTWILTWPGERY